MDYAEKVMQMLQESIDTLPSREREKALYDVRAIKNSLEYYLDVTKKYNNCLYDAEQLQQDFKCDRMPNIQIFKIEFFEKLGGKFNNGFQIAVFDYQGNACEKMILFGDPNNKSNIACLKDFINSRIA